MEMPDRAVLSGPAQNRCRCSARRGQQELDALFADLAATFSDCTSYEFEIFEAEVLGNSAYTAGFEHTSASISGEPRSSVLRATQIYRHEDGEWKVAHRHGSAAPE